jgi:thiol-disulfide isomerase/thioredoxin
VSALSYFRIVFKPTSLKLARVGEKTIDFSIDLLDSSHLSPASLKGRAFILDFWASWCAPCVGSLPHIRKLRDELRGSADVFSINVDKSVRRKFAEKIIADYDLKTFTSIRGLGNVDPVWQTFGGGNQNRLNIPLYVLIDKDSIVRYSGNGGQGLVDLKAAVEKDIRP